MREHDPFTHILQEREDSGSFSISFISELKEEEVEFVIDFPPIFPKVERGMEEEVWIVEDELCISLDGIKEEVLKLNLEKGGRGREEEDVDDWIEEEEDDEDDKAKEEEDEDELEGEIEEEEDDTVIKEELEEDEKGIEEEDEEGAEEDSVVEIDDEDDDGLLLIISIPWIFIQWNNILWSSNLLCSLKSCSCRIFVRVSVFAICLSQKVFLRGRLEEEIEERIALLSLWRLFSLLSSILSLNLLSNSLK